MSTSCKISIGYIDNQSMSWIEDSAYQRFQDGYPEAIIPIIKEFMPKYDLCDFETEYESHEFIELNQLGDGISYPDYIYYVDLSDLANVKVSILEDDVDFYACYGVQNYKEVDNFSFDGSVFL